MNYFILDSFHNSHAVWFVCFHEFTFNTPHLLTDLISSVSQPASFSHTAAAAGGGRGRWVSLDVIQETHTRAHITTQARTQYRFPVIPWKITTSSNSDPNICYHKISLSVCVLAKMSRVSPLLISLPCSKAQSTLSHWGDLTRLTSQLYSHTPPPRSFSRSQKVHAHSAVLKRNRMQPWSCFRALNFSFSEKKKIRGCKESCRWQFHCRCQRKEQYLRKDSDDWCQRRMCDKSDTMKAGEARSVTSYSGAQIPSIHSSCSPGNSSFLFRSKMAWNTKVKSSFTQKGEMRSCLLRGY